MDEKTSKRIEELSDILTLEELIAVIRLYIRREEPFSLVEIDLDDE